MATMKYQQLICLSTVILSLTHVNSELYTALVDLEKLLLTGGEVVNVLDSYLKIEEERLEKIKRLKEDYRRLHITASKDSASFLSNPVNAFLLVKRLTTDWKSAEDLIAGNESKALVEQLSHEQELHFPDEEDLNGAALALVRLQDTYQLDTAELAQGHIQGTHSAIPLTAGDCCELGHQTLSIADYYHTLLWMQEALYRLEREEVKTTDKVNVLEYMAYSTYMLGNLKHALKLTNDVLAIDPTHTRALRNKIFYQNAVNQLPGDQHTTNTYPQITKPPDTREYMDMYEKLCRDEKVKSDIRRSRLHCRYFTNNSSYLLLQPVKEEELHLSPRIMVYHDILSDKEIEVIKGLAQPKLARATVRTAEGDFKTAYYRISKSAWLEKEEHKVVDQISRRIEAVTGLSEKTSETLQVVNYGIGGHYEPHYDFAKKDELRYFESLQTGNRIATWLNYMSDVDAGGATVFTDIGVQVKPKKGSAAFWFNLLANGKGDLRTRHAACPVLAGSKWVSNKWFHERGQEFLRPCNLDPNK